MKRKPKPFHNPGPKLNYVFEVYRLACRSPEWIHARRELWPNDTKIGGPWHIAAKICADSMRHDEQGIRVTCLGMQEDKKPDGPVTLGWNFHVELKRDNWKFDGPTGPTEPQIERWRREGM